MNSHTPNNLLTNSQLSIFPPMLKFQIDKSFFVPPTMYFILSVAYVSQKLLLSVEIAFINYSFSIFLIFQTWIHLLDEWTRYFLLLVIVILETVKSSQWKVFVTNPLYILQIFILLSDVPVMSTFSFECNDIHLM